MSNWYKNLNETTKHWIDNQPLWHDGDLFKALFVGVIIGFMVGIIV